MTRKGRIAVVAIGAAVSLLMGSGLFALTSDTVRSNGNSIQSGTFIPPAHDLQAARVIVGEDCATATYTDGPFTAAIADHEIQLGSTNAIGQYDYFCLKNAGTESGRLTIMFQGTVESELGSCETSEADAGDATCSDADTGELKAVLSTGFSSTSPCAGPPEGPYDTFAAFELQPRLVRAVFAPGEICQGYITVFVNPSASETEKFLAQTDRVQWDIVFMLEDIPA